MLISVFVDAECVVKGSAFHSIMLRCSWKKAAAWTLHMQLSKSRLSYSWVSPLLCQWTTLFHSNWLSLKFNHYLNCCFVCAASACSVEEALSTTTTQHNCHNVTFTCTINSSCCSNLVQFVINNTPRYPDWSNGTQYTTWQQATKKTPQMCHVDVASQMVDTT